MPAFRPRRAPVSGDRGGQCRRLSTTRTLASTVNPRSRQKHRVSITEKTVARANCVLISREHLVLSRECAHEHQQRGLRQMEVRQKSIGHLEVKARTDEESGFAGPAR